MYGSKILEQLIEELVKLPTIGQKSAQRLALHLLRAPREEALALSDAIRQVRERADRVVQRSRVRPPMESDPDAQ